ncbi:o-succinylbenzoate synthase [Neiella sp. HB171785]|uniref:o-succinylbenzoate synthase n=1 Tax=Neiella litorisoli TaxID=2771431 RepID=A0A8J6QMS5_9GAMM|nr:o-succinylbenzoate synthase [Neiella litorisoli]MBD1391347.1 o-succinylbenzoate synthase [Neiella litorisoli]
MKNVRRTSTSSPVIHNGYRLVGVYCYDIPLTQPLQLAHGRLQQRQGLLLKFADQSGFYHWGEAAPLPGFSRETLTDAIDALWSWLDRQLSFEQLPPSIQFAIDMATSVVTERLAKTAEVSTQSVPLAAQLVTANETPQQLAPLAKLKIGSANVDADINRFNQLQRQFPATRWRLDCNQQCSLQQAEQFCHNVDLSVIDFIEEPCSHLDETVALAAQGVPVALDETIQSNQVELAMFSGLRALVCKPTLVGALTRCQQWQQFCQQHELAFIVSACFESNLTNDYLARLAKLWAPEQIPGLDTLKALGADLIHPRSADPSLPLLSEAELDLVWKLPS